MSADARAGSRAGLFKRLVRPVAAVALLLVVLAWVGPVRLREQVGAIAPGWFAAAVLMGIASNVVSALRWAQLARALGLHAPAPPLVSAYFQGIAVNLVIPGATLGGDALRALRLVHLGNTPAISALSVLLDRLSGLWVLCVLSLAATAVWLLRGTDAANVIVANGLGWYFVGLLAVVTLPWWPIRLHGEFTGWRARLVDQMREWQTLIDTRRGAVARSLVPSLVVQVLSATTLWLCAQAAGGSVGYASTLAVAAPIFIAAAIPMSISGFGPREFAATVAFAVIGAAPSEGATAAVLYGITSVLQGILGAPLLALHSGTNKQS
jgi:uncharacterized membrane protein YbhN (UPF0104 family)